MLVNALAAKICLPRDPACGFLGRLSGLNSGGGYVWFRLSRLALDHPRGRDWRFRRGSNLFLCGAPESGACYPEVEALNQVVSESQQIRFATQHGGGVALAFRRGVAHHNPTCLCLGRNARKEI